MTKANMPVDIQRHFARPSVGAGTARRDRFQMWPAAAAGQVVA
ncbi:hypothetical protein [Marivivens marinus]